MGAAHPPRFPGGLTLIVTAHQPVYHPWLGLLAKIAMADVFVSFDAVQYERKGWQCRQAIRTWPDGKRLMLTVPTFNAGHQSGQLVSDTRIRDDGWRRKHWRSIEQNYRRAPFWDRYAGWLDNLYTTTHVWLADLNEITLDKLLREFGLSPLKYRLRHLIEARKVDPAAQGNRLVLETTEAVGGDFYVFGGEGLNYAEPMLWKAAKIGLGFQFYRLPVYPQLHPGSDTGVWAFDLLLNHGPERARAILLKERDHELSAGRRGAP